MRWISTTLAALSLVLFLIAAFYGVRSYYRYEGALRFDKTGKPVEATATGNNRQVKQELPWRSTGVISYRGQLTWVSIANPIEADEWETWNVPADQQRTVGPMILVHDAKDRAGLRFGTTVSKQPVQDPIIKVGWLLPYKYFTVPYWMLAIVFAIWPYRWIREYMAEARGEQAKAGPIPVATPTKVPAAAATPATPAAAAPPTAAPARPKPAVPATPPRPGLVKPAAPVAKPVAPPKPAAAPPAKRPPSAG